MSYLWKERLLSLYVVIMVCSCLFILGYGSRRS